MQSDAVMCWLLFNLSVMIKILEIYSLVLKCIGCSSANQKFFCGLNLF